MTAASSLSHTLSPAVHPHEPGHHLTTALAGAFVFVLRRLPCRARGVTCSAGLMVGPVEIPLFVGFPPETLRADLAGSARTFGSLFCRVGLRLQALSSRACSFLRRVSLEALHRQRLRCCRSQSTTGPMAWASSNAGQIIQEVGA